MYLPRAPLAHVVFSLSVFCVTSASQAQWGDLKGRFVFDGEPPPQNRLVTQKMAGFADIMDESLVVHEKNKGIANVLVWLDLKSSESVDVHPSYNDTAEDLVPLTMKKGVFVPHIVLLRTSQSMVHKNLDEVGYNPIMNVIANPQM